MHKVGMRLICLHSTVQIMIFSTSKCHNLHNVQLFFASVQRTADISFRIFLQTNITFMEGAKNNSHDSDGHFEKSTLKNGCCKKKL